MTYSTCGLMEELLSNSVAADVLNELMPDKTPEQWALWLQNNRNQARRATYRIPFDRMGGGVFYRRDELAKFTEWEKGRKLGSIKMTGRAAEVLQAFGIGEKGGSTTGRRLKVAGITLQVDQASGTPFVQLVTDDPLMVYRLALDEAKAIAKELADAVQAGERIAR